MMVMDYSSEYIPLDQETGYRELLSKVKKRIRFSNANLISLADVRETAIDNLRSIKNETSNLKKIN